MAGPQTKGEQPEKSPACEQKPVEASADATHRKKVDAAFELMEKLDENAGAESADSRPGKSGPDKPARGIAQSGLRIRFGLDALVSDSDTCNAPESRVGSGEATLVDFDITLPYIWRVPVLGKAALKLIRHFQKEDRPKSVRDILKSLRQTK